MRSKIRRRSALPPPRGRRGVNQALVGLVLLVAGASVALAGERLVTGGPAATARPSAAASAVAARASSSAPASAAAVASAVPAPSPTPAAPILEAEMPRAVNGTTLTTQSATDPSSLGNGPNSRALGAAMTSLGKTPADLEIAVAYDATQSLAMSVLGFRVAGIDPAKLRSVVLDAWLSANSSGVTSSSVSLSGTPSTKVSYGDGGPDEYAFVKGDSLFLVETADESLAAAVVATMKTASPSAVPSASPSTAPSPSGG